MWFRNIFRDHYVLEFLDVEEPFAEKDLRKSIVRHLKDFVLEIGKDFTFVGEEYRVQIGNMVSEYTLKLIDKRLLQQKLKEYIELSESEGNGLNGRG